MFINHSSKQVTAKIVYYGPGLSGKTTNLQYIFSVTNPKSRGELVSIETDIERTLFFDLLPLNVGLISGYQTRFQLYTVPGQVFYDSTRRLVLKGADGIVFVADSQELMLNANVESLENLRTNLENQNQDIGVMPLVFQYNKRDLKNLTPVEALNERLNTLNRPFFAAVAVKGTGVIETLREVSGQTLKRIKALLDHSMKKDPHLQPAVSFDMDRQHQMIRRDELPVRKIHAPSPEAGMSAAPPEMVPPAKPDAPLKPESPVPSLSPETAPKPATVQAAEVKREKPAAKTLYDSDDMQKSPIARDPLYETAEVFQLAGFEDIDMKDLEQELGEELKTDLDEKPPKEADDSTADLENPLAPIKPASSAKKTAERMNKTEPEFTPPAPPPPTKAPPPPNGEFQKPVIPQPESSQPEPPPTSQPLPVIPGPTAVKPPSSPTSQLSAEGSAPKAKLKMDASFDLLSQLRDDSRLTIIKPLENAPESGNPITVEVRDKDRLLLPPIAIQYNPNIKKITIILDVKK